MLFFGEVLPDYYSNSEVELKNGEVLACENLVQEILLQKESQKEVELILTGNGMDLCRRVVNSTEIIGVYYSD